MKVQFKLWAQRVSLTWNRLHNGTSIWSNLFYFTHFLIWATHFLQFDKPKFWCYICTIEKHVLHLPRTHVELIKIFKKIFRNTKNLQKFVRGLLCLKQMSPVHDFYSCVLSCFLISWKINLEYWNFNCPMNWTFRHWRCDP